MVIFLLIVALVILIAAGVLVFAQSKELKKSKSYVGQVAKELSDLIGDFEDSLNVKLKELSDVTKTLTATTNSKHTATAEVNKESVTEAGFTKVTSEDAEEIKDALDQKTKKASTRKRTKATKVE